MVGENGAGKSTFLKVPLGLYPDFTGKLYRNGAVSRTGIGKMCLRCCRITRLYPATVAENVLLRECRKEDEMTVWEALRKVGLEEKSKVFRRAFILQWSCLKKGKAMFSAGEGQRLALCRVFAGDFDAVILDEPTAF